ncbi:MarR family winged helix-turn-helix transcriptional regulator [Cohnella soli]|uniref:MarR family winged helix-turn-helix transcriptional regulator n=1 Tax=Cohnella soli TaxID=425005 RepID=A0ABW0HXL4_9BACL
MYDDRNEDQQKLRVQQLFASFREVNQVLHQSMIRWTQRFGITPVQYFVLKSVLECPGIGLGELADKIHSVTSTTSGIVDRLVKAGWVHRERPEQDRRSIKLSLTTEGEAFILQLTELRLTNLAIALEQLPEEDAEDLQRIHSEIVRILHRQREGENDE